MSRWPADRARIELLRALELHAGAFTVIAAQSRDWASALFVGARHRLALLIEGEDAAARARRLCATLPETEFDLRGGFVADIQLIVTLVDDRPVLGIDALTIEEAETLAIRPRAIGFSRDARRAG